MGMAWDAALGNIWFKQPTLGWVTAASDAEVEAGVNPDVTGLNTTSGGDYWAQIGCGGNNNSNDVITFVVDRSQFLLIPTSGLDGFCDLRAA